jgi:tetratricopeptide (TPR) repeat protein
MGENLDNNQSKQTSGSMQNEGVVRFNMSAFLAQLAGEEKREEVQRLLTGITNASDNKTLSADLQALGDFFYRNDLYDRARVCYQHAQEVTDLQDAEQRVKLLFSIGNTYFMEGDYLTARGHYRDSLDLARKQNFVSGMAENLLQLSNIARTLGVYDEAESLGLSGLDLNLHAHRKRGIWNSVQSLCNLAVILEATGQGTKAKELLSACLAKLDPNEHADAIEQVKKTLSTFPSTNSGSIL